MCDIRVGEGHQNPADLVEERFQRRYTRAVDDVSVSMSEYIGLEASLKETAISVHREQIELTHNPSYALLLQVHPGRCDNISRRHTSRLTNTRGHTLAALALGFLERAAFLRQRLAERLRIHGTLPVRVPLQNNGTNIFIPAAMQKVCGQISEEQPHA